MGKGEMKNGRNKIIEIKDHSKQIQELLVITPMPTTLTNSTSLPHNLYNNI